MPRLRMLPSAQTDLVYLLEHITRETGNLQVAMRFVGALRQKCSDLASLPGALGRARPELRPDVRSFPFRGYVIFFRYRDDYFEVANIVEGHRDVDALFSQHNPDASR